MAREEQPGAEALLQPVIRGGSRARLPEAAEAREHCLEEIRRVRPGRSVEHSEALEALAVRERERLARVPMTTVYMDVDTQLDFLCPAGALYVPGAETIVETVAALNRTPWRRARR